jgi:hypothetical protein
MMLAIALALGAVTNWLPASAAPAQVDQDWMGQGGLAITQTGGALRLQWAPGNLAQAAAAPKLAQVPYRGYLLPMQMVALQPRAGAAILEIAQMSSVPWHGELPLDQGSVPPALDLDPDTLLAQAAPELPSAPLFELYTGVQRGGPQSIWAFSPLYQDPVSGEVRWAEALDATLAGMLVAPDFSAVAAPDDAELFAPVPALAAAPGPTNPLAARSAIRIEVAQAGIQEVRGATLAAAGLETPAAANLRIYHQGNEVAAQVFDADGDGILDPSDALRFYAVAPGDRWNSTGVYWLVEDGAAGLRMATRRADPGAAPLRATAFEQHTWRAPRVYLSTTAGADGDHWFHLDADTQPAQGDAPNLTFSAQVSPTLPLSREPGALAQVTLHMTAIDMRRGPGGYCRDLPNPVAHRLTLRFGDDRHTDNSDDWLVDFTAGCVQDVTRTFTPAPAATDLTVALLSATTRRRVAFDVVDWLLPVKLDFRGRGAAFIGAEGTWRYALTGTPAGRMIYDISDPLRPVVLAVPAGDDFVFQDAAGARSYLLAGPGTIAAPRVTAHTPVRFSGRSAHTVYLAPAALHAALEPLVDLRRSQGYQVEVIDIQHIYDAWSFGAVDPDAIRAFLRYAVGAWQPAPIAVVLVGDGTSDPHDYLGHGNPNHIPPYLADNVDPWLGETPCDACYGQLDGAHPLDEAAFLVDIWVGRLPVANTAELQSVVAKLTRYELEADPWGSWRRRSLQLADDFVKPDGTIDRAGNFPALAEGVLARQPEGIEALRNYFGAATDLSQLSAAERPLYARLAGWLVADSDEALRRSLQYVNGGAGLVTFTGHSNHWQWARLAPDAEANSSKRLLGLWDVLDMTNAATPFIGLSMTCLSSQFSVPAPYHFTLDEHLLLHGNGGAVAVFGPAGLSVAHGHDRLQEGFYAKLWSTPRHQAKLGALTQAAYGAILTSSPCCVDINRTFLLLGDPLTPARVNPLTVLSMPTIWQASAAVSQINVVHLPRVMHQTTHE